MPALRAGSTVYNQPLRLLLLPAHLNMKHLRNLKLLIIRFNASDRLDGVDVSRSIVSLLQVHLLGGPPEDLPSITLSVVIDGVIGAFCQMDSMFLQKSDS